MLMVSLESLGVADFIAWAFVAIPGATVFGIFLFSVHYMVALQLGVARKAFALDVCSILFNYLTESKYTEWINLIFGFTQRMILVSAIDKLQQKLKKQ